MRKIGLFTVLILLILLIQYPVFADGDTGTYKIIEYRVSLNPLPDGAAEMRYEQEWLVTGGHIPWVTVGLTNTNFQIKSYGGSANFVRADNYGSWNGVRVELDKDYKQNETFRFYFVVTQNNLLERLPAEGKWRIVFTPGWYDRGLVDSLQISLISPSAIDSFSLTPEATSITGQEMVWEKRNLNKGERFTVRIESTDMSFLLPVQELEGKSPEEKPPSSKYGGNMAERCLTLIG